MSNYQIPLRLTRLRRTPKVRAMIRETRLHADQLVAPIFISETLGAKREVPSMPGVFQFNLQSLDEEIRTISNLGIGAVLLFGIPARKDAQGSSSWNSKGLIQQAIRKIRSLNPNLLIIADVCFCEYTDHGHCGALQGERIDNDTTLKLLAKQAISYAEAGADWVAPSGMVDGMVMAIRQALDEEGFIDVAILSYAVKYSSSLYGPFREAAEGAPKFGNRKTYQMDPANVLEGLREAGLDLEEGADMLMVKPAGFYLDVIYRVKEHFPEIPLAAYQVSGEYTMLKDAIMRGHLDEKEVILESLLAIKRAGANFIISYFAKDAARFLAEAL